VYGTFWIRYKVLTSFFALELSRSKRRNKLARDLQHVYKNKAANQDDWVIKKSAVTPKGVVGALIVVINLSGTQRRKAKRRGRW
jgi:hypothetical protein